MHVPTRPAPEPDRPPQPVPPEGAATPAPCEAQAPAEVPPPLTVEERRARGAAWVEHVGRVLAREAEEDAWDTVAVWEPAPAG